MRTRQYVSGKQDLPVPSPPHVSPLPSCRLQYSVGTYHDRIRPKEPIIETILLFNRFLFVYRQ